MFQLQVLFAFLQKSQQAAYDPEPLVESLKIPKTEQQDAQEFSKLFLNLLDHEFKKQAKRAESEGGDAGVGKLVEDLVSFFAEESRRVPRFWLTSLFRLQFEGQITYGTRCSACGTESERSSSFLEVEISLAVSRNRSCAPASESRQELIASDLFLENLQTRSAPRTLARAGETRRRQPVRTIHRKRPAVVTDRLACSPQVLLRDLRQET